MQGGHSHAVTVAAVNDFPVTAVSLTKLGFVNGCNQLSS